LAQDICRRQSRNNSRGSAKHKLEGLRKKTRKKIEGRKKEKGGDDVTLYTTEMSCKACEAERWKHSHRIPWSSKAE